MRAFLNFASQLALGIVIVAAIAVASSGSLIGNSGTMIPDAGTRFALDTPSVIVGLAIGLMLPILVNLSWADLPRRMIVWVLGNERNFYRAGMACVLVGVLLFY